MWLFLSSSLGYFVWIVLLSPLHVHVRARRIVVSLKFPFPCISLSLLTEDGGSSGSGVLFMNELFISELFCCHFPVCFVFVCSKFMNESKRKNEIFIVHMEPFAQPNIHNYNNNNNKIWK